MAENADKGKSKKLLFILFGIVGIWFVNYFVIHIVLLTTNTLLFGMTWDGTFILFDDKWLKP